MFTDNNQTISLVSAPHQDQRYVGLCGAEALGYFGLSHRSAQAPNLGDLFGVQKLLEQRDESHIDGMLLIEPVGRPFQVGSEAIRLHSIEMVDDRKPGRVGNEGDRDESMDVDRFAISIFPQSNLRVTNVVGARSENLPVASLRSIDTHTKPVNASDSPEVTDLVGITQAGDMNWSPVFGCDNHATGRPSGEVGLAVKNPSRAPTLGGFAVYSSDLTSDQYIGGNQCP